MPLNLKSKIISFIIVCFILSGVVFAAEFTSFTGEINSDNINVRVDATVGSAVVCILSKGKLVEVVSEAYDWYKIRLPKEAPSYLKKDLVECINTDSLTAPKKCLSAKVIEDRINIRLSPSESSWILGKVNKLTVVSILSSQGDWYRIVPVHMSFAWVHKKFVNKDFLPLLKKQEPVEKTKEDSKPTDQLIIEGQVSPYGIVLWRSATHKLITPLNKVYLLKGNRKSLDSLNYHKVKVTGKLISPAESKYPIIDIDSIEVSG